MDLFAGSTDYIHTLPTYSPIIYQDLESFHLSLKLGCIWSLKAQRHAYFGHILIDC